MDFIFGNPGTTELPLMDALAVESTPRYILGLQEGAVMAMADGYAQASGKLAAVNVHVAPGLGNAMGMLYDAQKAGAPILVTAGQQDLSYAASEPILWGDLPAMARPFVKWAVEAQRLADLPRLVHRAAKTALAPPTGPVFLSLPADVLKEEADIDLGAPTRISQTMRGDPASIAAAAALLAAAKRPVIIAGDAVAQSRAHDEVRQLAELLGAPVYAEGIPSTASFPASHPLFRGAMARVAAVMRETLTQYDLLFSIGGDLFTMSLPSEVEPLPGGMDVIHLDTDPWEIGKNYPARAAILADPKSALPEILRETAARLSPAQREAARARDLAVRKAIAGERAALHAKARAEAGKLPIRPLALLQAIGEMLPTEAIVVDESLSSSTGIRHFMKSDDPQSFYGMRGGGIGWGMPAALGIKLAHPSRPVVGLIGDGSAMYNIQALWTAAHDRIAVVYVILNNRSYRILKQRTDALRGHSAQTGHYVAMDLTDPPIDFVALAGSLGVAAERVTTLDAVRGRLPAALAAGKPYLLDVEIDPTFR